MAAKFGGYRLFTLLSTLILIACLSGAQGQYQTPSSTSSATIPSGAQGSAFQYAQFYTMPTVSAPSTHITAPQQVAIAGKTPDIVYLSYQMQEVPYSQFQINPTYAGSSSLWIQGTTRWSQYAVVPQGATLTLLAISPNGGNGSLNLIDPDEKTNSYNFSFYPNSQLTFYADSLGRHILTLQFSWARYREKLG